MDRSTIESLALTHSRTWTSRCNRDGDPNRCPSTLNVLEGRSDNLLADPQTLHPPGGDAVEVIIILGPGRDAEVLVLFFSPPNVFSPVAGIPLHWLGQAVQFAERRVAAWTSKAVR